jgi:hypothetical protein
MTFLKFLSYNNAVPIAISIMLMGGASAFAATNPDAIYSAEEQVVSIDNSYIANKDLASYSPRVEITGVTEDEEYYYVAYNFYTIDLQDGVWRDVTKAELMNVSKADLGQYRDLGLYVTEQLKQKTERELAYLTEVQGIEKKNVSHKVVSTKYGGLVGKLLDTKTEELPGYTPVITPPPAPVLTTTQSSSSQAQQGQSGSPGNPSLTIQVLGNNPAQIAQRTSYADLGVVASDDHGSNLRIETYLDGEKVSQIQIDTTATSTYAVKYIALDPAGNSVSAERTIIVYDPAIGPPVPASEVQNGSGSASPGTSNTGSGSAGTSTNDSSQSTDSQSQTNTSNTTQIASSTPATEAASSTAPMDSAATTTESAATTTEDGAATTSPETSTAASSTATVPPQESSDSPSETVATTTANSTGVQ